MSEMEEKLGSILNNPQMMQQIMGMASALSSSQEKPSPSVAGNQAQTVSPQPQMPQIDPAALQAMAGLAAKGGIDSQQQHLLKALQPYLSRDRITRLERAMHAARMANAASAFLNSGGLQLLTGR